MECVSWEAKILEKRSQATNGVNRVGKDENSLVGMVE